jgi:arylsulfatase A-like enzyme
MFTLSRRDFLKLLAAGSAGTALSGVRTLASSLGNETGPNILILLFDAMSARHLSLYGYARPTTPNLERFAERATVYHSHFAGGNFTSPGTASMLTGLYPWNHRAITLGSMARRDLADQNIFRLIGGGYHRFGFAQNVWAELLMRQFRADVDELLPMATFSRQSTKPTVGHFFGGDSALAYIAYDEFIFSTHEFINPIPASPALGYLDLFYGNRVRRAGVPTADLPLGLPFNGFFYFDNGEVFTSVESVIARLQKQDAPYFGYFHLFAPHSPYAAQKKYIGTMPEIKFPYKPHHPLAGHFKQDQLASDATHYDEYIATVDEEIGRLLDALEAAGVLDNTYVILTSDHGDLFERGDSGHATSLLYDAVIHIPLLIAAPGQTSRVDVRTPTSNTDLLPTLLQFAGRAIPAGLDGRLLPGFGGAEDAERPIISVEAKSSYAFQPLSEATIALIKGNLKLIHYIGYPKYADKFELFDLADDPEEKKDLMPLNPAGASRLTDELLTLLDEADRPFRRKK